MTTRPSDYRVRLPQSDDDARVMIANGATQADGLLLAIAERLERLVTAVERLDKAGNFQGGQR